jgi:ElaB/YqjD/DUF883 family membrane-anchored ribosome-binding protein
MPENRERGSGDVHSRMSSTGGVHEEIDVIYTPDREVSGMEQAQDVMDQARQQAQDFASQAKDRMEDLGDRASDMASRAKSRLEGTGVMDTIRDHPLPALGAAFAVGYLLAGSRRHERGAMGMMRRQVRSAVMGGITAALAHEARSMMGMQGGGGGMLGSLFGGMQGGQGSSRSSRSSGSTSQRSQTQQHYH